jgi:hypothetical protein
MVGDVWLLADLSVAMLSSCFLRIFFHSRNGDADFVSGAGGGN